MKTVKIKKSTKLPTQETIKLPKTWGKVKPISDTDVYNFLIEPKTRYGKEKQVPYLKKGKPITLEQFEVIRPVPYVTFDNIEKVLGKRLYNKFCKWMYGQTCPMGGVYPWDLEQFLSGGKTFD